MKVTLTIGLLFASLMVVLPVAAKAVEGCLPGVGKRVPVLTVHGFLGRTESMDLMRRTLKKSTALMVERFTYPAQNTQWVDNPNIGPALAKKIVCIAASSKAEGGPGKVVIVAHSMGGLATRWAATKTAEAQEVTQALGLVVTLGTPNLGAFSANRNAPLLAACQIAENIGNWFWHRKPGDERPCLPAGSALQISSEQLRALPMLPKTVPVLAIAGDVGGIKIDLPFGGGELLKHSDVVVETFSAKAGAAHPEQGGGTKTVTCKGISLSVFMTSNAPCWHGALPDNETVQQWTLDGIRTYLTSLQEEGRKDNQEDDQGQDENDEPDTTPAGLLRFHNLSLGLLPGWKVERHGSSGVNDWLKVVDTAHCQGEDCPQFFIHGPGWVRGQEAAIKQLKNCNGKPVKAKDSVPIGSRQAALYELSNCLSGGRFTARLWHIPSAYLFIDNGAPTSVAGLPAVLRTAQWG